MNSRGDKVLLIKHRKLGIWIYPGGHLEKEENPMECALRETMEETGIRVKILSTIPFEISEGATRSTPYPLLIMDEIVPYADEPHRHFDILYLGVALDEKVRINEEADDVKWIGENEIDSLDTFENVKSIIRYGFETFRRLNHLS